MEQPQLIVDDTGLPPTHHRLVLGDARRMVAVDDDSIALVVTSPPYWTLKKYPDNPAQLGDLDDYELFQGARQGMGRVLSSASARRTALRQCG